MRKVIDGIAIASGVGVKDAQAKLVSSAAAECEIAPENTEGAEA